MIVAAVLIKHLRSEDFFCVFLLLEHFFPIIFFAASRLFRIGRGGAKKEANRLKAQEVKKRSFG